MNCPRCNKSDKVGQIKGRYKNAKTKEFFCSRCYIEFDNKHNIYELKENGERYKISA